MNLSESFQSFFLKQIVLLGLLLTSSKFGDAIMDTKFMRSLQLTRALTDSAVHFTLGVVSWLIATSIQRFQWSFVIESLICGAFASAIDVDHFIAARSFNLDDVLHLRRRPMFHNTTLMTAICVFFIFFMNLGSHPYYEKLGWILLVAVICHHLRDSLRRGMWLWTHYSTKPIDYYPYLMITYGFPLACGVARNALGVVTQPLIPIVDYAMA